MYIHTCMYQYRICNLFTKIKELIYYRKLYTHNVDGKTNDKLKEQIYNTTLHLKFNSKYNFEMILNFTSSERRSHPWIIIDKENPPTGHHRKERATHGSSLERKGHPRIIIGKEKPPMDHYQNWGATHGSSSSRKSHPWIIIRIEKPPMVHHQKGRATNGSSSNRKTHPLIITGQEEPVINHHRTGRTSHGHTWYI